MQDKGQMLPDKTRSLFELPKKGNGKGTAKKEQKTNIDNRQHKW